MEICKDCGHKNVGAIYCSKCGNALYSRRSDRSTNDAFVGLGRLLTLFVKRN